MKITGSLFRGDRERGKAGITLDDLTEFCAAAHAAGCPGDGLVQALAANITFDPDGFYLKRVAVPRGGDVTATTDTTERVQQ